MKVLRSRDAVTREALVGRHCRREVLVGSGQAGLAHRFSLGTAASSSSINRRSCDDQYLTAERILPNVATRIA
jgi:hypothetical protein